MDGTHRDRDLLERKDPSFRSSDTWLVMRVMAEFVDGFDALADIPPAVCIFGSARTARDDPMYSLARDTAERFARAGLAVITGGGPGIMEAANRGCREGGGLSIGCNIQLPFEQALTPSAVSERPASRAMARTWIDRIRNSMPVGSFPRPSASTIAGAEAGHCHHGS